METRLSRGKSMDPKALKAMENDVMKIIAGSAPDIKLGNLCNTSDLFDKSPEQFSLETIEEAENEGKSRCCGSSKQTVNQKKPPQSEYSIANNSSSLIPPLKDPQKITIVLDLDETLIHSYLKQPDKYDFTIEYGKAKVPIYVKVRPHAHEFLEKLAGSFELVLFSAEPKQYVDNILEKLDKNNSISHRLYKESCSDINGATVKDLALLGRNIKKVIIVDDSPMSYLLHPYNAVPISMYNGDENDTELVELSELLIPKAGEENVYDFLVIKD